MKIAIFLAGVFSFIGLANLPIGYYTFLRLYLTSVSVYLVVDEYKKANKVNSSILIFGIIAILFNPLIPIYLHDKEVWNVIDFVVGIIFIIKGINFREK